MGCQSHPLHISFALLLGHPLSLCCPRASVSPLGTPSPCTVSMPQFLYCLPPLCALYASVSPLGTPSPCTLPPWGPPLHALSVPQFCHCKPPLNALSLCLSFPIGDPLSAHCFYASVSPLKTLSMHCSYASVSPLGTPFPCSAPMAPFPHLGPLLRALSPCLSFPIAPRGASRVMGPCVPPPPFPSPPPIVPGSAGVPAPVTLMGCDTAGGAGCPLGGAPPVSCPQGNRGGIFDRPGNELLNLL